MTATRRAHRTRPMAGLWAQDSQRDTVLTLLHRVVGRSVGVAMGVYPGIGRGGGGTMRRVINVSP